MSRSVLSRWLTPLAVAWCLALAGAERPAAAVHVDGVAGVAGAGPSSLDRVLAFQASSGPGQEAPRQRMGGPVGGPHTRRRSAQFGVLREEAPVGPSARERRVRHLDFWMGDALARAGIPSWRPTAPPPVPFD